MHCPSPGPFRIGSEAESIPAAARLPGTCDRFLGILALAALSIVAVSPSSAQTQSATIPTTPIAWAVAVNPVTNKVYVVNYASSGLVTVIDGATNATSTIPVGSYPDAIDIDPVTNKIYVANSGSGTLTVIDGATNATSTITVGQNPTQVVVDSGANRIYVCNSYVLGTITVIDGATNAVTDSLFAGYSPSFIAINSSDHTLYVVAGPNNNYPNQTTPSLYQFNGDSGGIVSNGTDEFTAMETGTNPFFVAVDPVTNQVFSSNTLGNGLDVISVSNGISQGSRFFQDGGCPVAINAAAGICYATDFNTTHIINCTTYSEFDVYTNAFPGAAVFDPVANALYQTDVNFRTPGALVAMDCLTNAVTTLQVAALPTSIAVNPVTSKVYMPINDSAGTVVVYDGIPASMAPVISAQPEAQTMNAGSTVCFNVTASARPLPSYQWTFNNAPLSDGGGVIGSQDPSLLVSGLAAANAGSYSCTITNSAGSVTTSAATLSVVDSSNPGRIIDLSTLGWITSNPDYDPGANVLFAGFEIGGSGSKSVVLRGIGPSLASYGIANPVDQASLSVYDSASPANLITTDSGWQALPTAPAAPWAGVTTPSDATAADFNQVGAFTLPAGSADSAVKLSLPAGAYTSQVTATDQSTGFVLAEVYDDDPGVTSTRLTNISTRGDVQPGSEVVIAGFVIGGTTSQTVLIRASGPALANFHLNGLQFTNVLLYDAAGDLIASNSAWGGSAVIASTAAKVGAFAWTDPTSQDSALLLTLPPGSYTAEVAPAQRGGFTLIEVYAVP